MKTLPQLRALVRKCTAKDAPPLYRRLYGLRREPYLDITSWDDWHALPFVTKDLLLDTPFPERTFLPLAQVNHIVNTSGTSGKPPLFAPRARMKGFEYRTRYFDFKNACLISLGYPHKMEAFFRSIGSVPRVVHFDAHNPAAAIRLAKAQGVDNLFVHTFLLPLIGEEMKRQGMARAVRYIETSSEILSQTLFRYVRKTFPNAMLVPFYGATEIEEPIVGIPCKASRARLCTHFHERDGHEHHLETIDPLSGRPLPLVLGTEGEIVITAHVRDDRYAFPLIRYRVGDHIRIERPCSEHKRFTFSILGREQMDFVRLTGGTLRADEISRVLSELDIPDDFELHIREGSASRPARITLRLHAETGSLKPSAAKISARLRVGPSSVFADAVKGGWFEPLVCETLPPRGKPGKRIRIVRHTAR